MNKEESIRLSYRDAGVDIDAAESALAAIKPIIRKTFDDNVLCDIGTFGALYRFDPAGMEEPVLVSSVDSVGTKLKIAFMMNKHDTVGIDIVSHCVNDILVQGAKPMFFLDYIGTGKVRPEVIAEVVKGVATGCRYAGCALVGGEIAELTDMYQPDEYDLAGTIVGVVDRKKIVDGSRVSEGDVLLGLPSTGLHTNGYTLARKICFEVAGLTCKDEMPGTGKTVGEMLLEPHRSYAKIIQLLSKIVDIRGMAHITGGGITDNLPRILPEGLGARIDLSSWQVPPVFGFLQKTGGVEQAEMLRTFNVGVGYIVVIPESDLSRALHNLNLGGEKAYVMGKVVKSNQKVEYLGALRYGA